MTHQAGCQVNQVSDHGFDRPAEGPFVKWKVPSIIGDLPDHAQYVVGYHGAMKQQLVGVEFP